jgi:protein involved in polysaccharide export with SLBB domain
MEAKKRRISMSNKFTLGLVMFFFIDAYLFAQEAQVALPREDTYANTQLALSSPDYLVTPGDIYTLAYAAGNTAVTYRIAVDRSYDIRVSNLGVINAAGKTFRQLKRDAETIVANNYPLSGAQLVLTQPGIFRVFVNGEVGVAAEVSTWGLARLSSLSGYMTPYASTRNVSIKSTNGRVRICDLFKAERIGDLSQNPYLRPDDVITFNRLDRSVSIRGAVERPGVYQLLAGENLKELIESYACGIIPLADKTRMELERYVGSASVFGDKIRLTESDIQQNYALRNYDTITIPDMREWWPVTTME